MSKESAKKFYEKFIGSEEMQNELKHGRVFAVPIARSECSDNRGYEHSKPYLY